jgi:hypothetical protein
VLHVRFEDAAGGVLLRVPVVRLDQRLLVS